MSVISDSTKIKVSSTLDKSTPRKSLVDRDPGTCWTSTQGLPQWVQLAFPASARIHPGQLFLTFQGGFAGTRVAIYTSTQLEREAEWTLWTYVYPEDVNRKQQFDLVQAGTLAGATEERDVGLKTDVKQPVVQMKLVFEQSSDFFGRITLYDLDIHGVVTS